MVKVENVRNSRHIVKGFVCERCGKEHRDFGSANKCEHDDRMKRMERK